MLALTLIQPWASAIMTLGKNVENREWVAPHELYGRRFAIHAGRTMDMLGFVARCEDFLPSSAFRASQYPSGALLGTVELVACVRSNDGMVVGPGAMTDEAMGSTRDAAKASPWTNPSVRWQWVVREPRLLVEPIRMNGAQKLWRVPEEHVATLEALS